ncbi:hypothetical protein FNV43_RR21230 [Rhamnella rubrinervis]|uniref:Uncharacterized protein n=1 Tax=Rhamnella rubrinervis TaxID=2594499 RepID=A0A8K0E1X0_9ROSA|nr:hypothetical protein FNV43_RR21230 [Rhamnella rubrinervis]
MLYLKERATYAKRLALPLGIDCSIREPCKEGRYAFYTRWQIRLLQDTPMSDKGWKERHFFVKRKALFDPVGMSNSGVCSVWAERVLDFQLVPSKTIQLTSSVHQKEIVSTFCSPKNHFALLGIGHPSKETRKSTPNILKLNQCLNVFLFLFSRFLTPTFLKSGRTKRRGLLRKSSGSAKLVEPNQGGIALVQPKDLIVAILVEKSPPPKRQRRSSPPALSKDKGKAPQAPKTNLRLEDSTFVRLEPNQCALKVCSEQNVNFFSTLIGSDHFYLNVTSPRLLVPTEAVIKSNNAWKKKTTMLNNLVAMNKSLEEEEELRNLRLDFLRLASEQDKLQAQVAAWPSKKKIIYCKRVEDAFLKAKWQMIQRFKAEEIDWPTPKLSEVKGCEASEISYDEDELEDHTEAEKTPSHTRDSFMEAMDAVGTEGTGPVTNTEVSSNAESNQEDLLSCPAIFALAFCFCFVRLRQLEVLE